jgi:hypothetical protein
LSLSPLQKGSSQSTFLIPANLDQMRKAVNGLHADRVQVEVVVRLEDCWRSPRLEQISELPGFGGRDFFL